MGLDLGYINGQTPLDEGEKEGLLIAAIATREELDEFEQKNIEHAIQWLMGKNFQAHSILSEKFAKEVHYRMFNQVWKWAGSYRHSQKNLGVNHWNIRRELNDLIQDANTWLDRSVYPPDEFAIRFKHKMVSIHCFSNGNGRHSRLMADIIIEKIFSLDHFSWGAGDLDSRSHYIRVLKEADKGYIEGLLKFARS